MSLSPIPDITGPDIFAVTPALLARRGITLLLLDLDNTLAPYSEHLPSERVLAWVGELKAAGVGLFMISNSRKSSRADTYAKACDIPFIKRAGKPSPKAVHTAMAQMGKSAKETALMGDQIFTDGLAANRAGVLSVVVKPIAMKNLFFRARYLIEKPFRALAKEKV